jgi:hypothetical protein
MLPKTMDIIYRLFFGKMKSAISEICVNKQEKEMKQVIILTVSNKS